jgi:hypothetical protein
MISQDSFQDKKQKIEVLLSEKFQTCSANQKKSYERLISLLSEVTYNNRQNDKNTIQYFLIDSYSGDSNIGNLILEFVSKW